MNITLQSYVNTNERMEDANANFRQFFSPLTDRRK